MAEQAKRIASTVEGNNVQAGIQKALEELARWFEEEDRYSPSIECYIMNDPVTRIPDCQLAAIGISCLLVREK
jgi:hypothetical protein